jgi:3-phytase
VKTNEPIACLAFLATILLYQAPALAQPNSDRLNRLDSSNIAMPLSRVATSPPDLVEVMPSLETRGNRTIRGNAIWLSPNNPADSRVLTTGANGVAVYDMEGGEVQFLSIGSFRDIDIAYDALLHGGHGDLVTVVDPRGHRVGLLRMDPANGRLEPLSVLKTGKQAIRGVCSGSSRSREAHHLFLVARDSLFFVRLRASDDKRFQGRIAGRYKIPGQGISCAYDGETGALYVGSTEGIVRFAGAPSSEKKNHRPRQRPHWVDRVGSGHLSGPVTSLALYTASAGRGYLLAASGDRFEVYNRDAANLYQTSFRVVANGNVDGVEGSRSIDVLSSPLGSRFAQGLLVTQDRENDGGTSNTKYVSWDELANATSPTLVIDTFRNPRSGPPGSGPHGGHRRPQSPWKHQQRRR